MRKSKWINRFDIERSTQVKWSNLSTMLNMTCTVLSIGALSAYTVYLLSAMGYKCKASQDLKLAEAIFYARVVDKEMTEWRAKLRDVFGIDEVPSVNQTMKQLQRKFSSMYEKAQIPSRYESKARSSETQAWTNAQRGEQDETEPEAFSQVERSPRVERSP